jgi:lambda repressor-like predicted transcriptional regulator
VKIVEQNWHTNKIIAGVKEITRSSATNVVRFMDLKR